MSVDAVHDFFQEIIGDEDLLQELSHQETEDLYVEKVVETGHKLGYTFYEEDVRAAIKNARQESELTESQLEKAAGGVSPSLKNASEQDVILITHPEGTG